jgi:hypothetical protein
VTPGWAAEKSLLGLIGKMEEAGRLGLLGALPTLWEPDAASTEFRLNDASNDRTAEPFLPAAVSGPLAWPPPVAPSLGASFSSDAAPWWFTDLASPPAPAPNSPRAGSVTPGWAAERSLLGLIGKMQEPGRLGLLGAVPTLWESNAVSSDPGANDGSNDPTGAIPADDLARVGWPISKSGVSYVPPPPHPSISASQWLDLARLGIPNIVDYFTKPAPPPAPLPSTPGKIPAADANPYATGAIAEAGDILSTILSLAVDGAPLPALARLTAKTAGESLGSKTALSVAEQLARSRAQIAAKFPAGRGFQSGLGGAYAKGGVGGTTPGLGHTAANTIQAPSNAVPPPLEQFPEGSFSISDWAKYPGFLPTPQGPFRLLETEEYEAARWAANRANRLIRASDPLAFAGREIHEIHPVKFGGDPTDPSNKLSLTKKNHGNVSAWWYKRQRDLQP